MGYPTSGLRGSRLRRCRQPALLMLASALLAAACGPTGPTRRPPAGPGTQPASGPTAGLPPAAVGGASAPAAPRVRVFKTPTEALEQVLATGPRIVGFGEYHERAGAPKVDSAVKRFTRQLMGPLAAETSDLIVETWVTEGKCGAIEKQVVKDVKQTTERPVETENEVETLLTRARARRILTHVLTLTCKEYGEVFGGKEVDYVKMLNLITRQLQAKAVEVWAMRRRLRAEAPADATSERRLILLYGGALHNDLYPRAGYEDWSYAAALRRLAEGRFAEVDLFVPEYIRGDEDLRKEAWYPLFLQQAGPDRALLIERGPGSYVIVFPTTPAPAR
jgi:hypothetical protein